MERENSEELNKEHPVYKVIWPLVSNPDKKEFAEYLALWKPGVIKKNDFLLKEGDIPKRNCFVVKGCFRTYTVDSIGQENVISISEENSFLGDLPSMRNQTPTGQYIQALEDSEVLFHYRADYEYCQATWQWWRDVHLMLQQRHIARLQQEMKFSSETADVKYARLLKERPTLIQRLPQYHIAAYIGITPEQLSRIRKKIIST